MPRYRNEQRHESEPALLQALAWGDTRAAHDSCKSVTAYVRRTIASKRCRNSCATGVGRAM